MSNHQNSNTLKPSTELGILIGLLLTDGCVTNKWKIVFINKSEALHNLFKKEMKAIFKHNRFVEVFNKSGVKKTEVNSKCIVIKLSKFTPTFRTKQFRDGTFPDSRVPDFIFKLSNKDIGKILQAMFSADGSVVISVKWNKKNRKWTLDRRVKLASKHPRLREQIANLLRKLGFHPRIHSDGVALQRKKDLIKFQNEVRFVDSVKVTKNGIWGGIEKNTVLDILVKTFEISQKDINKFNSKKEIVSFLKSLS